MNEVKKVTNSLKLEDARIFYRNFSGRASKYNAEGNRNFCVEIPDHALADEMAADGWNIRTQPSRDEDGDDRLYIQVMVSFTKKPPMIYLVTRTNKVLLTEETVATLDYAEIVHVDLVVRPYNWGPIRGETGVKGYVKTMYVTIEEDEFAEKYADEEFPGEKPFN